MPEADDLLDRLDPEQRDVATALRGPVCVVAGAGTGKTRAITHRIAYGVATGIYQPQEVLAVTFTTRAAGEMRGAARRAGRPRRPGQDVPLRGTAPGKVLLAARVRHGVPRDREVEVRAGRRSRPTPRPGPDTPLLRDLSAEIEWAKVSNIRPADYAAAASKSRREVADLDPKTTVGR